MIERAQMAHLEAQADPAPILVVDDKVSNLVALEAVLEPLHEEIVKAQSGEEALKHVLLRDFAVILMDVQMPGLDGMQTAHLIKQRERSRRIPIIFLTAIHREPSWVFKGYAQGAVDYLLKPFDPEILRAKVAVFLDLHRKEQELKKQGARLRDAERRMLERRQELHYRALVEAMPCCVWATDAQGKVYLANRRWVEYSGMTMAEALDGDRAGVHPEDLPAVDAAWQRALRDGVPLEVLARLRRHDGVYRWHLLLAQPERDDRGAVIGFISTATDIDDQRRAQDDAEAASRTKDEFLAMVSHELRTPLNAILGWADMLQKGRLPPERHKRAIDVIVRNGKSQAQLIEDLLDVSRIVADKLRIAREPIDLQPIVLAAADTVRPAAEDKKIELAVEIADEHYELEGDASRLQQVVWNLLSNAVKFSGRGTRVELKVGRQGDQLEITVRDHGVGIPPAFLPHVFERFRQAEVDGRARAGLGLGLAIARHIVEQHGGSITAESEGQGRGAVFTVRLPAARSPVIEFGYAATGPITNELQPVSTNAPPRLDGVRVLVVDDERDARDLCSEFLAQAGAEVTAAASVEEALERLDGTRYDVLVSDLSMPHADGYALMRAIGQRGWKLPAIALSAHSSTNDKEHALEAGFQTHLAKPFQDRQLVELVARLRA